MSKHEEIPIIDPGFTQEVFATGMLEPERCNGFVRFVLYAERTLAGTGEPVRVVVSRIVWPVALWESAAGKQANWRPRIVKP